MRLKLIIIAILMISSHAFGWVYNDDSEIKVFLGKADKMYIGSEITLDLGNGIKVEWGMKNYLLDSFRHLRLSPSAVEYMYGLKIGDFGFQSFCRHDMIEEYEKNKNGEIVGVSQKISNYNPKYRIYLDIEQGLYQ